MNYLGLVGKKSSGKDTAFNALKAAFGDAVVRVSFADELKKEICEQLRADLDLLNANKNLPPFRSLLQNYGEWRRKQNVDYWILKASVGQAIQPSTKLIVFTDCRFQNEADSIRKLGGKLVRIVRPDLIATDNHISEVEQDSIFVDMHIYNDQTKLRLEKQIVDVVKNYFKLV